MPGGSSSGSVVCIGCPARDHVSAWWFLSPAVSTALTMGTQHWVVFGGCTFPGYSLVPVVGQKVLLDVTRQLLLEISMNFLLCTPHVCVTGLLVSLKAQRKQWRLTGFAVWFTLLK